MKLPRISLRSALDAWSDFAIECWVYALRFALALLALFYFWGITGRWNAGLFERVATHWQGLAAFVFAGGMLLAIAYRLERAFATEKKSRGLRLSGGRTAPTRRPKRTQWGNRKRKRKRRT